MHHLKACKSELKSRDELLSRISQEFEDEITSSQETCVHSFLKLHSLLDQRLFKIQAAFDSVIESGRSLLENQDKNLALINEKLLNENNFNEQKAKLYRAEIKKNFNEEQLKKLSNKKVFIAKNYDKLYSLIHEFGEVMPLVQTIQIDSERVSKKSKRSRKKSKKALKQAKTFENEEATKKDASNELKITDENNNTMQNCKNEITSGQINQVKVLETFKTSNVDEIEETKSPNDNTKCQNDNDIIICEDEIETEQIIHDEDIETEKPPDVDETEVARSSNGDTKFQNDSDIIICKDEITSGQINHAKDFETLKSSNVDENEEVKSSNDSPIFQNNEKIVKIISAPNVRANEVLKPLSMNQPRNFACLLAPYSRPRTKSYNTFEETKSFPNTIRKRNEFTDTVASKKPKQADRNNNDMEADKAAFQPRNFDCLLEPHSKSKPFFKSPKQFNKQYHFNEISLRPENYQSPRTLFSNDLFCIEFDTPTPRNHLIILFKDKATRRIKSNARDLNDTQLQSLLNLIDGFINKINGNREDITLSFHTGIWANTKYFHAHLILKIDLYLKLFNESNFSSNDLKPTKNWDVTLQHENMYDLYIKNVLNYDKVNSKALIDYKIKDITNIERLKQSHLTQSLQNDIQFYNDDLISLHYDTKEPRLKFIHKRQDNLHPFDVKFELVKSLVNYAFKKGYFEPSNGCHICLKVTNDLYGYLQLSGEEFYKIHPLKEIFLNNFSNLNETYVVET